MGNEVVLFGLIGEIKEQFFLEIFIVFLKVNCGISLIVWF